MDKKLVPLSQYNKEAFDKYWGQKTPDGNGIACPKCGAEMYDDGHIRLDSIPSQQPIVCSKCKHRDRRFCND